MEKKNFRRLPGICFIICCLFFYPLHADSRHLSYPVYSSSLTDHPFVDSTDNTPVLLFDLYDKMDLLNKGLSEQAFNAAIKGYLNLLQQGRIDNPGIVTIIDFSKPSTEKRLFVLDVENGQILFETYVSHGKNSGGLYAKSFSNAPQSHKSSLGFFITGTTYSGKHGYSLKLLGQEKGINDNAYRRAIVIHGANYVNERLIDSQGFIGRSYGCPALPVKLTKPVIDKIKGGSCLFIYYPSDNYIAKSGFL